MGPSTGMISADNPPGLTAVWAGVELADADDFDDIIATLYDWLTDDSPVEHASWGAVKAKFR